MAGMVFVLIFACYLLYCGEKREIRIFSDTKMRSNLMKIWILLTSIGLALATLFSPGLASALSPESAAHFEDGVDYMPNVIIVAFTPENVPLAPALQSGVAITGIDEVDELNLLFEVTQMRQLFPGAEKHGEIEMAGYYSITFQDGLDLLTVLEAYDKLDAVGHVEPDGIHPIYYDPDDPMIYQQWAIAKIEARGAWDITHGDPDIVLGIPDTGVDWDHPDLGADVWLNEAEINGEERVDDDDNGYVDDYRGWDWVTGGYLCDYNGGEDCSVADNNPMDFAGHGSHVSGITSAATDNGVGIAGVGFNCKIMALRMGWQATDGGGYVGMGFAASAFYYAANNGARGLNCSWGSSNSGGLGAATDYAINNGLIVISAAGNNNNQSPSYLCSRSDVMAVAATNSSDQKASFSSYGSWVDVSAPGVGIRSTVFNNSYANYDGTSMAAPHVLGLAGLIWSAEPALSRQEVIDRIEDTADNIDDLNPNYEGLLGSGRINAYAALASPYLPNIQAVDQVITITGDDGDGILNPGESFELVITLENIWADAANVTGTFNNNDVFSFSDSVASFGDIPHGGSGDNADNPYVLTSSEDAIPDASTLVLNVQADGDYETDLDIIITLSLDQSGFPLEISANIESSPLIFDFDMDGENELIIGANNETVYAIEADGGNSPGWPQPVSGIVISGPAVGDLAANGSFQIVAVTRTGSIYAWDADGSLLPDFPVDKGGTFYSGPMLIDLDDDDDLEIVVGSFSDNNIHVLNHDGSDYPGWPFIGEGGWYGSPSSGDLDGDGLSEIIYARFDSSVHAFNADGSYVENFPVSLDSLSGVVWSSVAVGDVDGDGHPEIAVATTSGGIHLINHDGSPVQGFPVDVSNVDRSAAPTMADMDGDGTPEIIIGDNNGMLHVIDADGSELFGFPVETGGSITASAVVGDITGDGEADIVVAAGDGTIYGYEADGNMIRNFPIPGSTNGQITAAALGDLDSDGDMEIAVGIRGIGANLMVIDYKENASPADLQWPNFGKDVWRSNDFSDVVTAVDDALEVPAEFGLSQNYPNPFNAKTTIHFSLGGPGEVTLSVFDLLGRRIRVLQSGFLNAGAHSIVWDGANEAGKVVASGIYFYRLESPEGSRTMRMLLLK